MLLVLHLALRHHELLQLEGRGLQNGIVEGRSSYMRAEEDEEQGWVVRKAVRAFLQLEAESDFKIEFHGFRRGELLALAVKSLEPT
ncbi:sorting nexin-15 [Sesbania bispinosa]|nr:sorting nexin-15 [Sesbania bispinosa]